jgi:septal ring factor EnvC (AmiA/AmiB activator)
MQHFQIHFHQLVADFPVFSSNFLAAVTRTMSKGGGGGPSSAELQKEIEMLKKVAADKDVELAALREQLQAKEDAMNRLEAEVVFVLAPPFPTP